jgi:hypothetical protein
LAVGKDLHDKSQKCFKIKVAVLPVISEIVSGAKINEQGKKQGNPGALTLPSTQSRPNESHISANRQDDTPIVQIWNRELSGNP